MLYSNCRIGSVSLQGCGKQGFAVSKSGTDDVMPSRSRTVVFETFRAPQRSPSVHATPSLDRKRSTYGAAASSSASLPSATSLEYRRAGHDLGHAAPDEDVARRAGAPVGSTARRRPRRRWPRALRNAMLTEQLYFCDSLRAILWSSFVRRCSHPGAIVMACAAAAHSAAWRRRRIAYRSERVFEARRIDRSVLVFYEAQRLFYQSVSPLTHTKASHLGRGLERLVTLAST